MLKAKELDSRYSTTRQVIETNPEIFADQLKKNHKSGGVFETQLYLSKSEGRQGEGGLRTKGYFKKSDEDKPLITIITVVFNGEKFLEKTILSVVNQTYDNVEYIIIDGGSEDGTLNIIQKYDLSIDYWISELDEGIYHAMNKALRLSTGDFINFLNAGDTIYQKDSIEKICLEMIKNKCVYFAKAKVTCGDLYWLYPNKFTNDYSLWLARNLPNHQAMFFPRSFYLSYAYDLRLKLTGDDDYKLLALKNFETKFIDQVFVQFERDGVSSNHKSHKLLFQRLKESYILNLKHVRPIRLLLDPFKRILTFFIHALFGEKVFFKFIRKIKKL